MPPRRVDDPAELAWLGADDDNGWCGYHPTGWPATTWVLHAAYRRIDVPEGGPPVVAGEDHDVNRHPGHGWERRSRTGLRRVSHPSVWSVGRSASPSG